MNTKDAMTEAETQNEFKEASKYLIKARESRKSLINIRGQAKGLMEIRERHKSLIEIKEGGKSLIKIGEGGKKLMEIREGGDATDSTGHRPPSKLPPPPLGIFENSNFRQPPVTGTSYFFGRRANNTYLPTHSPYKAVTECSNGDGSRMFQSII